MRSEQIQIHLGDLYGINIEDFSRSLRFQGKRHGVNVSSRDSGNSLTVSLDGPALAVAAYSAAVKSWVQQYNNEEKYEFDF